MEGGQSINHSQRTGKHTHDLVNAKDGPNIDASVDVAASVQWIKHDTVLSSMSLLDDDRVVELLGDEHGCLAGRPEGINHDVVGKDVELLLLLALHIGLTGESDPAAR